MGEALLNDGGMGPRALGCGSRMPRGHELEGKGEDLTKVADIDVGGLHPAVSCGQVHGYV